MSGRHSALAQDCHDLVASIDLGYPCTPVQFAQSFRELIECLLSHQVVQHGGDLFAVGVGSGMGMVSSGDIRDASLYSRLEKPNMLKPEMQRKFQIRYYGRFKDDIFVIAWASLEDLTSMFREMRSRVGFFKLKADEVSKNCVVMLDVKLFKSSLVSQAPLAHCLHTKPTSKRKPLGIDSMHHRSVHASWPCAQVAGIKALCSTASSQQQHLDAFAQKLAEAGCSIPNSKHRKPSRHTSRIRYIILPYTHVVKNLCVRHELGLLHSRWAPFFSACGLVLPEARVSWKLGDRHLPKVLKSKARTEDKWLVGWGRNGGPLFFVLLYFGL